MKILNYWWLQFFANQENCGVFFTNQMEYVQDKVTLIAFQWHIPCAERIYTNFITILQLLPTCVYTADVGNLNISQKVHCIQRWRSIHENKELNCNFKVQKRNESWLFIVSTKYNIVYDTILIGICCILHCIFKYYRKFAYPNQGPIFTNGVDIEWSNVDFKV